MKKLRYSVQIDAPPPIVWNTMLEDETYRDWTSVFAPGSYYVGAWEEGSKMLFLGPDPEGGEPGGMVSTIQEVRPHRRVAIKHIGMVRNGVEDTHSEAVKAWGDALETYEFREVDGGTEVVVELEIEESYQETFDDTWPKALDRLKELAEQAHRAGGGRP